MNKLSVTEFNIIGDERGSLIALEGTRNIPFSIKRVYYLFGTQFNVGRGFHAHKELKQIAVCVSGQARMVMDNGTHKEDIWLDAPNKAIFIDSMMWHEMYDFSPDCVMLVLASDFYDESDYIRNYDDYLRLLDEPKI